MSTDHEDRVATDLGAALGVSFDAGSLQLGTWGTADAHARLDRWLVVLEVESNQKHPSTNVAKLWPWLDEHPEERVLLNQTYFTWSPGRTSNRGRVAAWLGARMQRELPGRFIYRRLEVGQPAEREELRALVAELRAGEDPAPAP
jgi:hypothetical protein